MALVYALANQKGGVGKTTATRNLAEALSRQSRRVLMIDNDPQANLSHYCSAQVSENISTMDELYLGKSEVKVLSVSKNLDLIPSSSELCGVEYYLISKAQRESILRQKLEALRPNYDFIFIDNPPSLNLLTLNGLVASDQVLIPVQPEFFSLEGIRQIRRSIDRGRNADDRN